MTNAITGLFSLSMIVDGEAEDGLSSLRALFDTSSET